MIGGTRNNHWLSWAGLLVISGAPLAWGQPTTPVPPASVPEATLSEARSHAQALEKGLPKPKLEAKPNFDLSPARQERFRKYLPKTWRTLSQREPLHIVALGDSVFNLWPEAAGSVAPSFPATFAQELATQFFYTGGVYEVGSDAKGKRSLGPSIALRQLSRPGGGVLDAPGLLNATARQMPVDLILICYGQEDAAAGMSPVAFTHAIQEAVDAARKLGADVILCSPWLPMAQPVEAAWGIVRPLSDAVRELVEPETILHVDLGDVSRLLQVPESGKADEPRVFEAFERTYRSLFHEGTGGGFVPREVLHARLGQMIYAELLDGRPGVPWSVSGASASLTKPDHLTLQFSVENSTKKPLTLTILPLIAGGWKPVEATPGLVLAPAAKQKFTAKYTRQQATAFSMEESMVRMPVLICAGSEARVEDVRAPVQPLAIVWNLDTLFNQEEAFLAGCQLVNNSAKDINGTWQADMGGKRLEGKFEIKPEGAYPLDLRMDLSASDPPFQSIPIVVTIKGGGIKLSSRRQVEIVRNLGLNQTIPLRPLDRALKNASALTFQATADSRQLALTCAISDAALVSPPDGTGPAWQMDVNLDARSYGKRLEHGSTATVRITGGVADGPAQVHDIPTWAFGNEYAAVFDPKEFKATLSTAPDGRRLISLTLPKTYLYLHEWALENGNSQLGVNVHLTIRQASVDGKERLTSYALSVNAKPVDDVDSLVVLELCTKPTTRVTVNVF